MTRLLMVAALGFAAPAWAGDKADALKQLTQLEYDTAHEIHRTVKMGIVHREYQVGEACLVAHKTAKTSITTGRELKEAGKDRAAYRALREGLRALRPCVDEFSQEKAPKGLKNAVRATMRRADEHLVLLHNFIKDTKNPKATKSYEQAKVLRDEMKKKNAAGDLKGAVHAWFQMLRAFDQAVLDQK